MFSFFGPGFVGVCLEWGPFKKQCFVVNVYSKCSIAEKREIWDKMLGLKGSLGEMSGVWLGILIRCYMSLREGASLWVLVTRWVVRFVISLFLCGSWIFSTSLFWVGFLLGASPMGVL
jgi:hypothetical protein